MSKDKNISTNPLEEVVQEVAQEIVEEVAQEIKEEGEGYPIDHKTETVHFPWSILIICGVLILLMVACFVVIMMLEGQ